MNPYTTSSSMSPVRGAGGDEPYTRSSLAAWRRRRAPHRSCCDLHRSGADRGSRILSELAEMRSETAWGWLGAGLNRDAVIFMEIAWAAAIFTYRGPIGGSRSSLGSPELPVTGEAQGARWAHQMFTEITHLLPLPLLPSLRSLFKIVHMGQIWHRDILNF